MSKIEESKTQGETICIKCPQCKIDTNHTVEKAIKQTGFIEGPDIHYSGIYQIVRCNGCDTISFRGIHTNSEDFEYDRDGGCIQLEREYLYPERIKPSIANDLYLRDDVYDIPQIIQAIYQETIKAVQHDLPTLSGIGIRAVIEAICQDMKAQEYSLAKKIDELVKKSLLTPAGAEILHGIRLLGNDAAHDMKAPTKKQITAALKVIDHLLLGVYVLPQEADIFPKPKPKTVKATNKSTKAK